MLQGRDRQFQSTPPARGATVCVIRAPPQTQISIHAPREGGDVVCLQQTSAIRLFQSTPPARGATPPNRCGHPSTQFQSTPPARGATKTRLLKIAKQKISIHAPREGGDIDFDAIKKGTMDISIHAPREGGDSPEI